MSHINAMSLLVDYMHVLAGTLPHVMSVLREDQRLTIFNSCVMEWVVFNRALYEIPTMYVDPPTPMPVDPHCPPLQMSDHIRERLGKCHPFFDFIHAPFTHPLGTQLSLVCINYCWDAYDTFVKQTINMILETQANHPNVTAFKQEERRLKGLGQGFSTESKLQILDISATQPLLQEFLDFAKPSWQPAHANAVLEVAKALRTIFAHHFGRPDEKLLRLMRQHQFEAIRIVNDELEVLLPFVADVSTVVQGLALIIDRRWHEVYSISPGSTGACV